MSKSLNGRTKLCNCVCALLTLCLMVLQFTPFWHYGSDSISINGYVWLEPGNTGIANWFSSQLGSAVNINSIVITCALVLLFGVVGIILCIVKSDIGLMGLFPAISAISGIYAFALKPAFRLGSTWIIQLILCIVILVMAVITVVSGHKDRTAGKDKSQSRASVESRVAAIRLLSAADEKAKKKKKSEDSNSRFNQLLNYLYDEAPECRIAAAEELGKTSRDVVCTHISHILLTEKDEKVIKALRASLSSIHENMRRERSEKA